MKKLLNDIPNLARIATYEVQNQMKKEALARGEMYKPRPRPGITPNNVAKVFWLAHREYRDDKTLEKFKPEFGAKEQDRFRTMLTKVSQSFLREHN